MVHGLLPLPPTAHIEYRPLVLKHWLAWCAYEGFPGFQTEREIMLSPYTISIHLVRLKAVTSSFVNIVSTKSCLSSDQ